MAKLTDAQIYTLRRMNSGTSYCIQSDGRKALERRFRYENDGCLFKRVNDDISAPSIPPLVRLGYAEFFVQGGWSYHPVHLTEKGREAARTLKVSTEL